MISPAEIDFLTQQPEAVRGVGWRYRPVNWEALASAVDHSLDAASDRASPLKRARMKRALLKAVKKNGIEAIDHRLRYNYVRARLALGDFSDYWGWEFRNAGSNGENWAAHLYWEETWLPKWGGGGCDRLLVLGEQGLGDAVFAASILPDAMCRVREVVYECDDRLHSLLSRSLPGLKCKSERQFEDRRADYGKIDAYIPSFELLRMFRRSRKAFPGLPYLRPSPKRVDELQKYYGRVGIAWRGRQGSIEPGKLGLDNPVSLQYKETHPLVESPEVDLWEDIEGIVALCSVLKKIVTIPTTVHHLAGALGKRVEIIVPEIRNDEALNTSPWDYSTRYNHGRLLWYLDAQVFDNIETWRSGSLE